MARARQPQDWTVDVANARSVEADVRAVLCRSPAVSVLEDHTLAVDQLDFRFRLGGRGPVWLEVKEKRQRYNGTYTDMWAAAFPDADASALFIVDETSFRRLIWHRGFLAVRDLTDGVWWYLGPWHLILGRRLRYQRLGNKNGDPFLKGKILISLMDAYRGVGFDVDVIDSLVKDTVTQLGQVAAVALPNEPPLRTVG